LKYAIEQDPIVDAPTPISPHEVTQKLATQTKSKVPNDGLSVVVYTHGDRVLLHRGAVEGILIAVWILTGPSTPDIEKPYGWPKGTVRY
jgi:hypothetical protein